MKLGIEFEIEFGVEIETGIEIGIEIEVCIEIEIGTDIEIEIGIRIGINGPRAALGQPSAGLRSWWSGVRLGAMGVEWRSRCGGLGRRQ